MAVEAPRGREGGGGMPPRARNALAAVLAALLLGGIYLAAVRGDALLIDLAGLARFFCL